MNHGWPDVTGLLQSTMLCICSIIPSLVCQCFAKHSLLFFSLCILFLARCLAVTGGRSSSSPPICKVYDVTVGSTHVMHLLGPFMLHLWLGFIRTLLFCFVYFWYLILFSIIYIVWCKLMIGALRTICILLFTVDGLHCRFSDQDLELITRNFLFIFGHFALPHLYLWL